MKYKIIIDDKFIFEDELEGNFQKVIIESTRRLAEHTSTNKSKRDTSKVMEMLERNKKY